MPNSAPGRCPQSCRTGDTGDVKAVMGGGIPHINRMPGVRILTRAPGTAGTGSPYPAHGVACGPGDETGVVVERLTNMSAGSVGRESTPFTRNNAPSATAAEATPTTT